MSSPRFLIAATVLSLVAAPAAALDRPRDQNGVFRDAQRGKIMPLPKIEQRASEHPAVSGARLLGSQYNEDAAVYRMKFIGGGGRVIFVDVDARTGRVLQISGN